MRASHLTAALGRPVLVFAELDSTNRFARAALQRGALGPGDVVVAEGQTAGRGRLGRSWEAQPGQNLLFSVLLAPKVPVAAAPRCVLLWAAALAEVAGLSLKWPNDLVSDQDQKVGGLLAELEVVDGAPYVVLGVGLNVNQREFAGLPGATSLARLRGGELDREALLIALVEALDRVDVAGSLDPWRARARTLGRRVRIGGVEGLATAIREDGALLVDGVPILTGDVELVAGDGAGAAG